MIKLDNAGLYLAQPEVQKFFEDQYLPAFRKMYPSPGWSVEYRALQHFNRGFSACFSYLKADVSNSVTDSYVPAGSESGGNPELLSPLSGSCEDIPLDLLLYLNVQRTDCKEVSEAVSGVSGSPCSQVPETGGEVVFSPASPVEEAEAFQYSKTGRKIVLGRDYFLRVNPELSVQGRHGARPRRRWFEKPHGISHRAVRALRGDIVALVYKLRASDVILCFETFTAPDHEEFAPDSIEYEDSLVNANRSYFHNVSNLRVRGEFGFGPSLYTPLERVGISERQSGARRIDGGARGAPHFHFVVSYRHLSEVPYFSQIQNFRWLRSLDRRRFKILSSWGMAALDRGDAGLKKALSLLRAARYEPLVVRERNADGELEYLPVGEYGPDGRYHSWFAQPYHLEYIDVSDDAVIDRLCVYFLDYVKGSKCSGLAGSLSRLKEKFDSDVLGVSNKDPVYEEGLYRRRFFASQGLRIEGKALTDVLSAAVPGIGRDRVVCRVDSEVLSAEVFVREEPSMFGMKRFWDYQTKDSPDVARPYRLIYAPQNGVTCQTGVPLDFSDRSVGAVIYDLSFGRKNADGKRKFTPLRSFLFAGRRFAEGAVKLMISPPAVQRRIKRFFSEPAFDPNQPLYREFVMRASRMKRPFSPDYVPSKEYLELVSC